MGIFPQLNFLSCQLSYGRCPPSRPVWDGADRNCLTCDSWRGRELAGRGVVILTPVIAPPLQRPAGAIVTNGGTIRAAAPSMPPAGFARSPPSRCPASGLQRLAAREG